MKDYKPTVTIGIPAFNEEKNIASLLRSIRAQKTETIRLVEVIIVSDGSTDGTVPTIQKLRNKTIRLITHTTRRGQSASQNQILSSATGDILILLNADVTLKNPHTLEKLTAPISQKAADLVSMRTRPINASTTLLTKILNASITWKEQMYESWNQGNNIYTCSGRVRAFSKRFYRSFRFKQSVGEDAFSFISARKMGMRYSYENGATVYYRLPEVWSDHVKQSIRFFHSVAAMPNAMSVYTIPRTLVLKSIIASAIRQPLLLCYFPMLVVIRAMSLLTPKTNNTWDIALSSK